MNYNDLGPFIAYGLGRQSMYNYYFVHKFHGCTIVSLV